MMTEFNWLWIGPVADSCEHGNEPSGSMEGEEFLDYFSDWRLPFPKELCCMEFCSESEQNGQLRS